jgi:hypothetical protein
MQEAITSGSATSTPSHQRPVARSRKRRCKSVGANARKQSFIFPTTQYAEFEMACCTSNIEMNTMAGSAVTFSKNLINRISTRFRQKKPLQLKSIQLHPERKNIFTRPLGMQLPKDLELAMRYLQEIIRNHQTNMYLSSMNEMTDSLINYLKKSGSQYDNNSISDIRDSFQGIICWIDNQIIDLYISHSSEPSSSIKNYEISTGLEKLANLEKTLLRKRSEREDSKVLVEEPDSGDERSSSCSDSGVDAENITPSKKNEPNYLFTTSNGSNAGDDTLSDLLQQLQLRKIERFEPQFPSLWPDSDEDDNDVHVDEESEEREEKHGSKTCEEEIERRPDGREIRMKKTRTVNVSQSHKSITIRTHGGGSNDIVKKFRDGSQSFNDDSNFESSDFFKKGPFAKFQTDRPLDNNTSNSSFNFDEEPSSPLSPDTSTKTKTLQHSSATLQSVARHAKRDGKLIADNAAHKLDTADLNAKQIDTYQGNMLLDRKGDGSYEESIIIRNGLPGIECSLNSTLAPLKRNVIEITKTVGDNNVEGKDNFFQATSLASYITLNDNLRLFEEQHRRKVTYTFGSSGTTTSTGPTHSFINLKQLLQVSDSDRIVLPTVYIDDLEEDVLQKAITFPKPLLQITDKPTILESLNVSEYLVLRAKDAHTKPTEVRGGPKDALIVYATQPTGSLLYQEAFLTTYRGFVSSLELIQKLVRRYLFMNLSKELNEIRAARQTFSVLVRVVDELCTTELTLDLISMVTSFVYRLIRDGNYDFARLLRKRLMERIQEKAPINLNTSDSSSLSSNTPNIIIKPTTLFQHPSSQIAKQITYLDSELFHKIEPAEMLWWAKDQDPAKSPNVVLFTEHFNKISYWVRTHVLLPNEHREREKYFLKFIKIMKQLRKMGNLSSYLAILSALDSGPVRRLDWSKSLKEQLNEHTDIIDSKMSFKNYRAVLAETQPPCLPYIGLILQDLTFVDVGNPDYLSPAMCNNKTNLLNYGKRWQQFAILDNVRRFKSWTYNIQKDEKIHKLFNGFSNCLGEEEAWTRSLEIKPRKPSGRN